MNHLCKKRKRICEQAVNPLSSPRRKLVFTAKYTAKFPDPTMGNGIFEKDTKSEKTVDGNKILNSKKKIFISQTEKLKIVRRNYMQRYQDFTKKLEKQLIFINRYRYENTTTTML